MDEEEISDDLPDLEAQLYAQVHHEHVDSKLTFGIPIADKEEDIKDVAIESNLNLNTTCLNEDAFSTERKTITDCSDDSSKNLTQIKDSPTTARDQHENHLLANHVQESSPHRINNDNDECIIDDSTIKRMESVIVNKGISVVSNKPVPAKKQSGQEISEPKQTLRTERRKSITQRTTNDNNENDLEGFFKKDQNRESFSFPNKRKTPKSKENSQLKHMLTIEIDSSGDDDVVVLPPPVVPIYTVEDSDDDDSVEQLSKTNVSSLGIVETAMDSSDVQINYSNFVKPTLSTYIPEKRTLENSSRCTSPSSVFSTDDFIVQQDRQRLNNIVVADNDDDLVMLDIDTSTGKCESSIANCINTNTPDLYVVEENSTMPKRNFRVEQSQFRALDVYESESDIPESIYGKGKVASKETVIRTLSTTDEDDQCVLEERNTNTKTKRLCKRRSSDSRKSCDAEMESSDDDDVTQKPKKNRPIKIPYIEPGEAVERLKSNKLRKSPKTKTSCNETDSFIAAINSLAQGACDSNCDEEEDGHTDTEETLTARQIAEKVLEKQQNKRSLNTQHANQSKIRKTIEQETEKEIFDDLNKMMEVVDVLGKKHENNEFVESNSDCEVIENNADSKELLLDSPSNEELESEQISSNSSGKNHTSDGLSIIAGKENQSDETSPIYYIQSIDMCGNKAGIGWSDEQCRFYTNSWNGETFDINNVWKSMSNIRKLWKVAPNDPFASTAKSPHNKMKCFNCCQYGHKKTHCPYPMRPKVCRVCGYAGHLDVNCHKKCCLRCGTKTNGFVKSCNSCLFRNRLICSLCKIRGHSSDTCPDKWRRYHSTTKPNHSLNSRISYNVRIYCYNCGKRGHYGEDCKKETPTGGYPKISSRVKSYDKTYANIICSNQNRGILCNLLYEPQIGNSQNFKLFELTKPRNYYGRFLNAVGLGYLLRKRRAISATSESPSQSKKKCKVVSISPVLIQEETIHALEDADTSEDKKETNQMQQADIELETVKRVESNKKESVCSDGENLTVSNEPAKTPIILDSDSNYSFSEFDMGLSVKDTKQTLEKSDVNNGLVATASEVHNKLALKQTQVDKRSSVDEPEVRTEVEKGLSVEEPELHKELPVKDSESKKTGAKIAITNRIPLRAPMGPTLDFIPLESKNSDFSLEEDCENSDNSVSFYDTDDEESKNNSNNFNNLPLVAKIYLTYQRGKYLSSPEGKQLLAKLSKETNVTSNLYWSTAGPVITLEGLSVNQDEFHRRLQNLFKAVSDNARELKNETSQQMPKRVGVLIKFLTEHFDMLKGNLGNANDLHKRMRVLDLQNEPSKNSLKNADKLRRQLNMILIGQAGLQNGKIYLQSILQIYTTLQNDYKVDEVAPKFLRDELFLHWKKIFTPFRHENYEEIMQSYKKLNVKNYFITLNTDVNNKSVIDVSLTAEQKERMNGAQETIDDGKNKQNLNKTNKISLTSCKPNSNLNIQEKQLNPEFMKTEKQEKNSGVKDDETNEMKTKNTQISSTNKKKTTVSVPPFINPEQRSNLPKNFVATTDNENSLKSILFNIENSIFNKEPKGNSNSNKPSMFWSRECIDFLNNCHQIVRFKPDVAATLERVMNRANSGLLSCNDYIALKKCCDKML